MCGSPLTRIYTVKMKELEWLNKTASSSVKSRDVEEQMALIEEACLTNDSNIKPILPVCDEGECVLCFPCPNLFPFLCEFDLVARQEIKYHTFHRLGDLASNQCKMEWNKIRIDSTHYFLVALESLAMLPSLRYIPCFLIGFITIICWLFRCKVAYYNS